MANTVYDQPGSAYDQDPDVGHDGPAAGDESDPRGDLSQAEQGGLYNPGGDGKGSPAKAVSPGGLKDAEEAGQGDKSDGSGDDSLYNPNDKGSRSQKIKARFRSLLRNKWLVGLGLGGTGTVAIILLLLLLLGNFKIIQLAEHISAYQFARLTRNYAENVNQITAEDTALSTADRNALQRAYDQFGAVKDNTWGSMWDKINNYRPDKIVENMASNGTLDFKYERGGITSLWKKKLTAVVVNGKEIPVNDTSLFDKYVHPLQARRDRIAFSDEVNGSLAEAMQGRSSIIRGAVAKAIRDEYGINLQWWKQLTEYKGANQEKAAALTEAEAEATIDNGINPAASSVNQVSDAEAQAQAAEADCASKPSCIKEVTDSGGKLPSGVLDAINGAASSDIFHQALGFVNPVYTVSLPVCLIYDGSLQSGPGQGQTINNTNVQDQRSYYAVATAADQQKFGNTTGEAVGGMDWKLGDTSKSIPEMRASGLPVDTSSEFSPQASSTGDLGNTTSIFSFLPSPASGLADSVASGACPLVTNIWTGAVVGIGNLIAGFFTGETSTVAEDGLAKAITTYLVGFAQKVATKKEAAKLGLFVGGTEGLTILAKMLVAQKAGVANSGFATGPSFDNAADAGGNLNAQQTSRGFYGRPLNNKEVSAATYRDQVFAAATTSHEGAFQRYFALTNPDSLATKLGTSLSARFNMSFLSSLMNIGARLLNPLKSLGSLFGSLSPQAAMAAGSADNQNYGIVQWGWSNDEENLIKDNPDFFPLENQKILEASGQSDAIEQKYGLCFDMHVQMGDMLTGDHPLITRDSNGDVTDGGLCSPANLSYTNNEFGPAMVFRWRLEKSYEVTLDQLTNMQTVSSDNGTPAGTANGLTNPFPDGWIPNRLDMGYDGTFKNRIVAPFAGTITYAADSFSNWGGYLEIKSDQPLQGLPTSTFYFAEGVKPTVHSGQHVNAGDQIASPAPSPFGDPYGNGSSGSIEWGLAQAGAVGSPTNTYVYGQCGSAAASKAVLDFAQWVVQNLGVAKYDTSLSDNTPGCP